MRRLLTAGVCCVQLTDQKVAMETLLTDLGVTAKTNFVRIKGIFDEMDTDGSGDVSGDELTRASFPPLLSAAPAPDMQMSIRWICLIRSGRQVAIV